MWGHLRLYLAEPGLKRQRGGRFRTLHARGRRRQGPRPVCPMAARFEDRIPGLGCAPHVCPGESVFLRETGKRNMCPQLEHAEPHLGALPDLHVPTVIRLRVSPWADSEYDLWS